MPEYPRHLPHFSYSGVHRYSLTFCTFARISYFRERAHVDLVLAQILRAAGQEHVAVIAYCFMPDHLHLLVEGTREDADLKKFVARAKQFSGYYLSQTFRKKLWQRYGYEHVLRNGESTLEVAKYIIDNPIRAGLVHHPLEYPFWGSSICSRKELLEYVSRARAG